MFNPFSYIWKGFKKVFGSAPAWTVQADNVIAVVDPLLDTILELTIGSEDAATVSKIVDEVRVDLKLLGDLVTKAKSGDGSVKSVIIETLKAIAFSIGDLLSAGHVKNDGLRGKLSITVKLIVGEVQAVIGILQK